MDMHVLMSRSTWTCESDLAAIPQSEFCSSQIFDSGSN